MKKKEIKNISTINVELKSKNAIIPSRAHSTDAGADVYANIEENIVIKKGEVHKIPLGIGIEIPEGYMGVIHCKSGLSSKGIFAANAPIDSGYSGEVHAIITNVSKKKFILEPRMKIGQIVISKIETPEIHLVAKINSGARGDNGFGSTGK